MNPRPFRCYAKTFRCRINASAFVIASLLLVTRLAAQGLEEDYRPQISPASNEGERAVQKFSLPDDLQVQLFAAEPLLANPVAFCFDEQGKLFVAETFRHHAGVTDTRGHMYWLDDDLASRSVEDRVEMFRKHLGDEFDSYAKEHERVRRIVDADDDGRADSATVFAQGFNSHAAGIGAGLLARGGDVYYACIPHLWRLRDTDGDGVADERDTLHYGYGVHVGFLGHDLHGLCLGPDGRLYFSIGDRGLNVHTGERHLFYPDTGTVLRCNLDGSDLEVFAYGLRNPQELAFNEYGDLFTGDNNSDGGDEARWVHVIEGGDSGWRIGYQFMDERGPWNREKLWYPHFAEQAAYIVPPVANLGDGPSGLAYYPGTGLPDRYQGHFFLCDFRGASATSGIRAFTLEPEGASFRLVNSQQFLWHVLATDVDFGPDSNLYFSDWVEGWEKPTKGRIYRVFHPTLSTNDDVASVRRLLSEGFDTRSEAELISLLQHGDMRIRRAAQFALAERGDEVLPALSEVAKKSDHQLARIHAIWAIGQIGQPSSVLAKTLIGLLSDAGTEIRAQAARVLGEMNAESASDALTALLEDSSARVRLFTALSLGKLGDGRAIQPLLAMLNANNDTDPALRHAGVMGLMGIAKRIGPDNFKTEVGSIASASKPVRMAVLLTCRRLQYPLIATFLDDEDSQLITEAARAINDVPIEAAMSALAEITVRDNLSEPAMLRALNANFRLGGAEHADRVAAVAGRRDVTDDVRIEAMRMLVDWANPSGRDRVVGLWRPLDSRSEENAASAFRNVLQFAFQGSDSLAAEAAKTADALQIAEAAPLLRKLAEDTSRRGIARVHALNGLHRIGSDELPGLLDRTVKDENAVVRAASRTLLGRLNPLAALESLSAVLESGTTLEMQNAFSTLGEINLPAADRILSTWLDRLIEGNVPLAVQLELINAAKKRSSPEIEQKLAEFESKRAGGDVVMRYRESLEGGDAASGENIFYNNEKVFCQRCHRVDDRGGNVGPDLTRIGTDKSREYLLEAIVDPNKVIAKGFESIVIADDEGRVIAGVLREEDEHSIQIVTAEAVTMSIDKDRIDERSVGKSAMPEQAVDFLSMSELRDLVEFLAAQR